MKLKKGFITHTVGGTQMMVAVGPAVKLFHGLVRSNETAAFIVECLKKETTTEEIVDHLCKEYEVEPAEAKKDVENILEQLNKIGALE